ncbi:MAG: hypothetical protein KGJ59_03235 [Bacteroidota bacterium]|nr:hypothetical protein [Bacteroidota bacterium]
MNDAAAATAITPTTVTDPVRANATLTTIPASPPAIAVRKTVRYLFYFSFRLFRFPASAARKAPLSAPTETP